MKIVAIIFFLPVLMLGCGKPVSPVSIFKVEEIAFVRAAIFGPNVKYELDSAGNYTSEVLDSIELNREAAQAAVTTLLAGRNYTLPDYSKAIDGYIAYGVGCHTPHFILQAYDSKGFRSNLFTICFTCGNVRITEDQKSSKYDELMMSLEGEVAFMNLQDALFPAFMGTFFWDPIRRFQE